MTKRCPCCKNYDVLMYIGMRDGVPVYECQYCGYILVAYDERAQVHAEVALEEVASDY